MARYDKYDPKDGGFRAPIAADHSATPGGVGDADGPEAVGLDANGRVVPGSGQTGVLGVLALPRDVVAGDVVDVMTDGELVEFVGAAGTTYFGQPDGTIGTAADDGAGTNYVRLGSTVEADRLVVRAQPDTR